MVKNKKKHEVSKTKKIVENISKKKSVKKRAEKIVKNILVKSKKIDKKDIPTLQLKTESDIAMDFAVKVYQKFNKIIKSVVLFGSLAKQTSVAGSDIDIIILIDDVSIRWDQELIAWYREELDKIMRRNPYNKSLHINTIKLSTWWEDLMRGDPVVLNILRYGEEMIDFAGFFFSLEISFNKWKNKINPRSYL